MAPSDSQDPIRQMWQQAITLKSNGEWPQAVEVYTKIINLAPGFAPAYVERGLLVYEMGSPEKASHDFDRAIELDPQFGPGYYGRGWVKHITGDFNGEMQDAKRGLLLDKENAGMYYRRIGAAHQGLHQYQEAIDAYNAAIDFYSGREEGTIYNRGLCYLEMKEYTSALADFNRSLEMDPDWAWAFAARARTYLRLGEHDKAMADCNSAIRFQPDYIYTYLTRGLICEELGNTEQAKMDFEHILKSSKSPQLRNVAEQHLKKLRPKKGWFG